MRRTVMSSPLSLCVVSVLISQLGAQSAQPVQPPVGFPSLGAPPTVTLTIPGAEPRRALRYVVANGHRERLTIDTATTMTMSGTDNLMRELKEPLERVAADLEVRDVSNTGDIAISWTFTDSRRIAGADTDPAVMTAMSSLTPDLRGVSGTVVMSDRGVTRDVKFDASQISSPQLSRVLATIQGLLQSLSVPTPEEAVGAGAEWEVRRSAGTYGVQVFEKLSVQLITMDDRSCTLKATVEQTAPSQAIPKVGISGATASFDDFKATGVGTMTMQFGSLSPATELNINANMNASIDMRGGVQRINMRMAMKRTATTGAVK